MATVGELVEEEWQEYVAQNDMVLLSGATVPCMNALAILRDLGIWDAEVLEGQIIKGYDEEGEDRFGIAPLDGKYPYVWIGSHDEVVRIIVLKGE